MDAEDNLKAWEEAFSERIALSSSPAKKLIRPGGRMGKPANLGNLAYEWAYRTKDREIHYFTCRKCRKHRDCDTLIRLSQLEAGARTAYLEVKERLKIWRRSKKAGK